MYENPSEIGPKKVRKIGIFHDRFDLHEIKRGRHLKVCALKHANSGKTCGWLGTLTPKRAHSMACWLFSSVPKGDLPMPVLSGSGMSHLLHDVLAAYHFLHADTSGDILDLPCTSTSLGEHAAPVRDLPVRTVNSSGEMSHFKRSTAIACARVIDITRGCLRCDPRRLDR